MIRVLLTSLCLYFVELGDHEVVEGVCVPRRHERREKPSENAHETSKLGQKVQKVISNARVVQPIEVHLDSDSHPLSRFLLQRQHASLLNVEQIFVLDGSPVVKVEDIVVLLRGVGRLNHEPVHDFDLAAYREVDQAFFLDRRLIEEVLRIEAALVVNKDDILA